MNIFTWSELSDQQQQAVLWRPKQLNSTKQIAAVQEILTRVKKQGDKALLAYTKQFDALELTNISVTESEFDYAEETVARDVKRALRQAKQRIDQWHKAGIAKAFSVQTAPGVQCGRIIRPIQRVGLYIPAGSAPLPSTVLMLGIPAQLANCPDVILCTPAQSDGRVNAAILVAAKMCGISRVYKIGGAQAIAAMAYGTETIKACAKIFGPGNSYVTTAKQIVQSQLGGPAIDIPAGPSEVLVIADSNSYADFVAADLLAQAEHGPDSQVICISTSSLKLKQIIREVNKQRATVPRQSIVVKALNHARFIKAKSLEQAIAISNHYAPEHLILSFDSAKKYLTQVQAAGSVFVGKWASESLGDYCSGTNHTLPTNGYARAYSGVSVSSFQVQISTQMVSAKGIQTIGPCAETLARCEQLDAHANSVSIRLKALA